MSKKIYGVTVATPLNPNKFGNGQLEVAVDPTTMTANYTATQIIEYLNAGGTAFVNYGHMIYASLYGKVGTTVLFGNVGEVGDGGEGEAQVALVLFAVWGDGRVTRQVAPIGSESTSKTFKDIEITENADGSVTMVNTFTDGSSETIVLAAGEKPASATYNGVEIPIKWVVGA